MPNVPSLRAALGELRKYGCEVEPVRRTGEVRVSHHMMDWRVLVNARRSDASKALMQFLREVREIYR